MSHQKLIFGVVVNKTGPIVVGVSKFFKILNVFEIFLNFRNSSKFWKFFEFVQRFQMFSKLLMHFWSITEIVYKPCAGRHLMFIVYSRYRLVVVYGQKVEIFVHFQMFITSSILELRRFWAQFWNSQDPLYRFPGTNKNNITYKITLMGKIYPCVYFLSVLRDPCFPVANLWDVQI